MSVLKISPLTILLPKAARCKGPSDHLLVAHDSRNDKAGLFSQLRFRFYQAETSFILVVENLNCKNSSIEQKCAQLRGFYDSSFCNLLINSCLDVFNTLLLREVYRMMLIFNV